MSADIILKNNEGEARVSEMTNGKRRIKVTTSDSGAPLLECETAYPTDLIKQIFEIKGLSWLCDEIEREESPRHVRANLELGLLSFLPPEAFVGKTILDFGCGSGASTVILGRMFPQSKIIGIDFLKNYLEVAKARIDFYKLQNVSLVRASSAESTAEIPRDIDFIVLSGVYEHFLPNERKTLFPALYRLLKPGSVMFLGETPYRYFPIERHTTGGLFFINYLPDWLTFRIARRFSKKKTNPSWQEFLRDGIRGGSISEIKKMIRISGQSEPELLKPSRLGMRNDIDLWYSLAQQRRAFPGLKAMAICIRLFKALTGISLVHILTIALRKPNN